MKKSNNYNLLFDSLIFTDVAILQKKLLDWFEKNGRHWIPWKLKGDGTAAQPGELIDPYRIWIAEVMLQQTQLKTVLPYWEAWMHALPTLEDLSQAEEEEVLLLWQGLGYYSRARRIHKSAKILICSIGSKKSLDPYAWPKDLDSWIALPGIGRSTAGSIVSSAFSVPAPILDGNVKRVFSRLFASHHPVNKQVNSFWMFSQALIEVKTPREFNQALMDMGATICTPRKPKCSICPWKSFCIAYACYKPVDFPVKMIPKKVPFEEIGIGIVLNNIGQVLIDKRKNSSELGGLWEFPGGKRERQEAIQSTISRELMEEMSIKVEIVKELMVLDHQYSHKKLRFYVHICKWISGEIIPLACQEFRWVNPENLSKYPFPAANIKMIKVLLEYLIHEEKN